VNYTQNQYTLTTSVVGSGSITRDNPGPYHYGDILQLTAVPATGWSFSVWGGDLSGSVNPTSITIDGNKSVIATFINTYTLSVSKTGSGSGTATSNPAGINCGSTCSASFNYNTSVTLTATASTGSTFTGWSGACSGTGTCAVTMDADKTVTAIFGSGAFNKSSPSNGATSQPTSLTLSWNSSSGATSYDYCYDTSNDNSCAGSWVANGTSTNVVISSLSQGTTYYWQVRANNTSGTTYANGSSATWWWFTTTGSPPGAFNKISPTNRATKQPLNPTLTWNSSSGATSYEYCYDTVNNTTCDTSWVDNGTGASVALSGLSNSKTYYWQVRANNSFGTTYANGGAWWSFTTGSAPAAFNKSSPANAATNQPTSLTFSWSGSSGATSYDYCYDTTNDNTCSGVWVSTGTSKSAAISGLSQATIYYWQVRANNNIGTTYANGGAWWSFTTSSAPVAFNKTNPAKSATNQPTSLTLRWSGSSGATSYNYCYDKTNDNACSGTWVSVGMSNSASISGLSLNTTYYWQVRAVNSQGTTYANSGIWWSFKTVRR
jgi:hypothetical protein